MEDRLKRAVSIGLKLGANQVETFGSVSRNVSVSFENERVKRIEDNRDMGIGIRVIITLGRESSLGSGYTSSFSTKDVAEAVKETISVAKSVKPETPRLSFESQTNRFPSASHISDSMAQGATASTAAHIARSMFDSSRIDRRIKSVSGDVSITSYEVFFNNSLGVRGTYEATLFETSLHVTAKRLGSTGSGFDGFASRALNPKAAQNCARSASRIAISQLNPRLVEAGKTSLILGPEALESLYSSTLRFGLRADFAKKNQSPFANCVGRKVASDSVTILDDGTIRDYVGSKPFDDEGHEVTRRHLIEKGVLHTFLHDHKSSADASEAKAGNALRPSGSDMLRKYTMEPQILPHNLVVEPGRETLDSLFEQVQDGVYVRAVIGASAANRVTGEFSVVPEMSYRIVKGEISYPIREGLISGNISGLLSGIEAVAREVTHIPSVSGDSSFTSAPVLVEGLSVTR